MESGPQDYALNSAKESASNGGTSDIEAMKERMRKRLQSLRDEENEDGVFGAMMSRKFNERN